MTAVVQLEMEARETAGTGSARAVRRAGRVPGIIYGGANQNEMISVEERVLVKHLHRPGFFTTIFEASIGGKKHRLLPKQIQLHPVTDRPEHIDFLRLGRGTKLTVTVPIHYINQEQSPGLKRGGVLNMVYHDLQVNCDAEHLIDQITVDMAGRDIGDTVHLVDLNLPQGVVPVHADRVDTIATIIAPSAVKSEAAEAAEAAEAEATPASEPVAE